MKLISKIAIIVISLLVLAIGVSAVADYGFSGKTTASSAVTTADMQDGSMSNATCPSMKNKQCSPEGKDKASYQGESCSEMKSSCSDKQSKDCGPDGSCPPSKECPVSGQTKGSGETTI